MAAARGGIPAGGFRKAAYRGEALSLAAAGLKRPPPANLTATRRSVQTESRRSPGSYENGKQAQSVGVDTAKNAEVLGFDETRRTA